MTQNHLFKALLIGMVCSFIQVSAMEDVVILQSKDGQDFQVEVSTAERSKTLKDLIEDAGVDKPIPLKDISGKTLRELVPLMKRVYELQVENERAKPDEQIYIPRAYQSFVNILWKGMPINEVVELYNAANYLVIRFILNAVAAVIADRIPEDMRDDALSLFFNELDGDKKKEVVEKLQQSKSIGLDVRMIPKDTWPYIGKHLQFRKCGIEKEYSVADYIMEHGKPQLIELYNTIILAREQLTSLFGIQLVSNPPTKVETFLLVDNCFVDFSLDVQGRGQPFAGFNSLESLSLDGNKLRQLQKEIYKDLGKLQYLGLRDNPLDKTQKEQLGQMLPNVDIKF